MRFSIEQPPFLEALSSIVLATQEKTPRNPIHSLVRIEAFKQKVSLYGHEDEVQMAFTVDATVEEEGHVAVNAKDLLDLVKAFSSDKPLSLSVDKTAKLKIKQSRSSYNIAVTDANQFPAVEFFSPEQYTPLDPTIFLDALKKVSYARSTDNVRPALTGINFSKADEGLMRVATCDGHQLAVIKIPGVIEGNFTLTGRALKLLEKTLPKVKDLGILVNGSRAHFCFDKGVFNAMVLAPEYPAYGKAFPTGEYSTLILNRQDIIGVVKRLLIVSMKNDNKSVFLDSEDEIVRLSGKHITADASEELEILEGSNLRSPLATAFNGQYFLHALEKLTGETVSIRIYGPVSPILFSHDNFTQLIMPLKR